MHEIIHFMNSRMLLSSKTLAASLLAVLLWAVLPWTAPANAQVARADASRGQAATPSQQEGAPASFVGACPVAPGEVDDQKKAIQYSLYYENYKNDSYEATIPYLRWMLQCAPLYAGPDNQDDRNFERAIKTYEGLAEAAKTDDETAAYLDSALKVFDMGVETMEEAGVEYDAYEWTFDRGYFIQSHAAQLPEVAPQAAEYYQQAYQLEPSRLKPYYIDYIISSRLDRGQTPEALAFLRAVDEERGAEQEIAGIVTKYLDLVPPQERAGFLEARLEKDPGNVDLLLQLFDLYEQMDDRANMYAVGEQLQEVGSSPKVTRRIATMYINDGESSKAFELLEAMLQEGAEATAEDYFNMGLAQQNMDHISSARTYYRKALDLDADYGAAYAAIGDLYASAVSTCSGASSLQREDRAVYWLATDYYEKAKSAAPSLANRVNQKISTYRRYFPTAEALFFWGKSAGDRYAVDYGCYAWIDETTTVRKP